jgi:hypothetical protein
MTLELPGGRVLRLGDALAADYPAPLRELAYPDLRALWQPLELAPAPVADWSDQPGRLRFIAGLFRAHHADATLFDPPFAAPTADLLNTDRTQIKTDQTD